MNNLPKLSGMVRISDNAYLIVRDKKTRIDKGEPLDNGEPRIGIIRISKDGVTYEGQEIINWPKEEALPSDLEAVCAEEGSSSRYLLVESGFYQGNFGRIVSVEAIKDSGKWVFHYRGHFQPFPEPQNGTTEKSRQIEGAATVKFGGKLVLILVTRGSKDAHSQLLWGELNVSGEDSYDFSFSDEARLYSSENPLGDRGAGSMRIISGGSENEYVIQAVATVDPGEVDLGPFRSIIYKAGVFSGDDKAHYTYRAYEEPIIGWSLEGLKVEGLADQPALPPGSALAICTDDEMYGGVWRPLLPSIERKVTKAFSFRTLSWD